MSKIKIGLLIDDLNLTEINSDLIFWINKNQDVIIDLLIINDLNKSFISKLISLYNKYSIISLQKNLGVEQIKQNNYEKYILDYSLEIDNDEDAYKDSISILRNLDLVITSDSSIAHLAATMNINTWIALSYNPDWRWYIENKKSVFYNTLKIFQQKKPGHWKSVFDEINSSLLKYKIS